MRPLIAGTHGMETVVKWRGVFDELCLTYVIIIQYCLLPWIVKSQYGL